MAAEAKPVPGFEDFSREVDTDFSGAGEASESLEFRLIEAKEHYSDARIQSFALMFVTATEHVPAQGIFTLRHDRLGEMDMFLVPVDKTGHGVFYEASFNLIKEAAS
jgi:hypothetical protein